MPGIERAYRQTNRRPSRLMRLRLHRSQPDELCHKTKHQDGPAAQSGTAACARPLRMTAARGDIRARPLESLRRPEARLNSPSYLPHHLLPALMRRQRNQTLPRMLHLASLAMRLPAGRRLISQHTRDLAAINRATLQSRRDESHLGAPNTPRRSHDRRGDGLRQAESGADCRRSENRPARLLVACIAARRRTPPPIRHQCAVQHAHSNSRWHERLSPALEYVNGRRRQRRSAG